MKPKFGVVGLGNPGERYKHSWHNVGFMVLDLIATDLGVRLETRDAEGQSGSGKLDQFEVILVKPLTFMNDSGRFVAKACQKYGLAYCQLIVIHDDMDLGFGQIRVRPRGSSGGHRGVQSIIDAIGSEEFGRIKVGIGRPPTGMDPKDYVLSPIPMEHRPALEDCLKRASMACYEIIRNGYQSAMNRFNSRATGSENA